MCTTSLQTPSCTILLRKLALQTVSSVGMGTNCHISGITLYSTNSNNSNDNSNKHYNTSSNNNYY